MLKSWLWRGSERSARRPVSRVLSPLARGMTIHLGRPLPSASRDRPGWRRGNPPDPVPGRPEPNLPPLLGLAPGGVYPATAVTGGAVRSYRTLSPLPPWIRERTRGLGGLLSVALSLRSPSPGISRHRVSVEPGLSSPRRGLTRDGKRPSGRLAHRYICLRRRCVNLGRGSRLGADNNASCRLRCEPAIAIR